MPIISQFTLRSDDRGLYHLFHRKYDLKRKKTESNRSATTADKTLNSPTSSREEPVKSENSDSSPPRDGPQNAASLSSLNIVKLFNDGKTKNIACIPLTTETFQSQTLENLRSSLISREIFDNVVARSPFCTRDGAIVEDSTTLWLYFGMNADASSSQKEESESQKQESESQQKKSETQQKQANIKEPEKQVYQSKQSTPARQELYVKTQATQVGADDRIKAFLKEKLDLEMTKDAINLPNASTMPITSDLSFADWAAKVSSGDLSHPADMTETDWHIVSINTSFLCGHHLRKVQKPSKADSTQEKIVTETIDRSVYSGFIPKARRFGSFSLDPSGAQIPGALVRIPWFEVSDKSSIEIIETKSAIQDSLARASFSSSSVEASVGGGGFGYSVGAKAGVAMTDQTASGQSTSENVNMMHVTYRFPRVVLYLDADGLDVSEECLSDWRKWEKVKRLDMFYAKYGEFFATRVELGGRLHSAQSSETVKGGSFEDKSKSLKAAASLSFSSPWAQASASASHEDQSKSQQSDQKSTGSTKINWEAHGGDTLLANSPPDWCPTVASFYNWRVINQYGTVPLPTLMNNILARQNLHPETVTINRPVTAKGYSIKFTLSVQSGSGDGYLGLNFNSNPFWTNEKEMFENLNISPESTYIPALKGSWQEFNPVILSENVKSLQAETSSNVQHLKYNQTYPISFSASLEQFIGIPGFADPSADVMDAKKFYKGSLIGVYKERSLGLCFLPAPGVRSEPGGEIPDGAKITLAVYNHDGKAYKGFLKRGQAECLSIGKEPIVEKLDFTLNYVNYEV